jgi:hypothetical protein
MKLLVANDWSWPRAAASRLPAHLPFKLGGAPMRRWGSRSIRAPTDCFLALLRTPTPGHYRSLKHREYRLVSDRSATYRSHCPTSVRGDETQEPVIQDLETKLDSTF